MIQSFNGLTVILYGKFSFYSYIIIKKWKMRISDILPVSTKTLKYRYVNEIPTIVKVQIP